MHDPAQVRCMRLASGFRDDELAAIAGVSQRAIYRWENSARQVPDYIVEILAGIMATEEAVTAELAATATETGVIRVYKDNAAASAATAGRLPFASAHRVAAARAFHRVPSARLVIERDDVWVEDVFGARSAGIGLTIKALAKALQVSVPTTRRWASGQATPSESALAEFVDLEEIALQHLQTLLADSTETVRACRTQQDVNRKWPELAPTDSDLGLELSMHQTAAGLAAFTTGKPLAFMAHS